MAIGYKQAELKHIGDGRWLYPRKQGRGYTKQDEVIDVLQEMRTGGDGRWVREWYAPHTPEGALRRQQREVLLELAFYYLKWETLAGRAYTMVQNHMPKGWQHHMPRDPYMGVTYLPIASAEVFWDFDKTLVGLMVHLEDGVARTEDEFLDAMGNFINYTVPDNEESRVLAYVFGC